jgi:hypothetical protein
MWSRWWLVRWLIGACDWRPAIMAASFGIAPYLTPGGGLASNEPSCQLAVNAAGQPILGPNGEQQQGCEAVATLGAAFFRRPDAGIFINCGIVASDEAYSHCVAHEVGHSFGLSHDSGAAGTPGIITTALGFTYLDGLPNPAAGVRRWNAIMATSGGRPTVYQWSKGEYAGEWRQEAGGGSSGT